MHSHRFHAFDPDKRSVTLKDGWEKLREYTFAKDLSFPGFHCFSPDDPVVVVFERMDWGEDRIVSLEKAAP